MPDSRWLDCWTKTGGKSTAAPEGCSPGVGGRDSQRPHPDGTALAVGKGWWARKSLARALDRKARAGWPTCPGRRLERAAQFDESRPSCEVIGRHQRCVSKHGVPRGRRDFGRIDVEDVSNANGRRPFMGANLG